MTNEFTYFASDAWEMLYRFDQAADTMAWRDDDGWVPSDVADPSQLLSSGFVEINPVDLPDGVKA